MFFGEWMVKQTVLHEYCLTIRRNELLIHAMAWMYKGIKLSEKKKSQKVAYLWFHTYTQNDKIIEIVNEISSCQESRGS